MDTFQRLKGLVKIREVFIDNEVFQLHYRVTAVLLLGCAALVASKQHFGDPIDCITRDDVSNKIMDTYCWIHATFTLPDACNKTVGSEVAHPCVDKSNSNMEDRVYHKYYQWVYFVLFFQAMCFYAPHFFWKTKESKLLLQLTESFKEPVTSDKGKEEKQNEKISRLARYFTENRSRHQAYFNYFIISELANCINVILQVYIVDEFLGGTFTTYGLDVIQYAQLEQDDRVDPMVRVFPRMTKCTFHRFGSSGDVQRYDALCILPLNIINEKIYIVMWFWFVFLALVTSLWLIYRLATYTKPKVRINVIARRANLTDKDLISHVVNQLDKGDWFLLSMMCKNMDSLWFRTLMEHISDKLDAVRMERLEDERKLRGKHPNFRRPNKGNNYIDENRESGRSNKRLLDMSKRDDVGMSSDSELEENDDDDDDGDDRLSRVNDIEATPQRQKGDEKKLRASRADPNDFDGVAVVPNDQATKRRS